MERLDGSAITFQRRESSRRTTLIPPICQRGHAREAGALIEHVIKVPPVDYWFSMTSGRRKENCNLMKVYMIWPVLHSSSNAKTLMRTWEIHGLDMAVKELNLIELLEELADLFTKISEDKRYVTGVLNIGCKMEKAKPRIRKSCVLEACLWVKSTGEATILKLQECPDYLRNRALQTFFSEYAFFLIKMAEDNRPLTDEIRLQACDLCEQESRHYKHIGNKAFAKGDFTDAEDNYTSSIYYSPENPILFSNRALCYLRTEKYGKAMCDGKKAILLKNTWPKGHYRFCEALFHLGEWDRALKANDKAQEMCKNSPEGIVDLVQQQNRFNNIIKEEAASPKKKKKAPEKRTTTPNNRENKSVQTGVKENAGFKDSTVNVQTEEASQQVTESQNTALQNNGKSKGKGVDSVEKSKNSNIKSHIKESQKLAPPVHSEVDPASVLNTVKSLVREGHEALADQRFHSAEGTFSQIIEILGQEQLQPYLRLSKIDHVVLLYGHATALLGVRKSAELARAESQFKEIIHQYSKERFNCLAFYGIGNVYLKQNRFSDALDQYIRSKTLLAHKMVPGVLTWPTTSVVLEETRPERLQVLLEGCIEECKFPPRPDAVCRYENCLSLPKIQIYFTDPDFKGFIRMACCHFCVIEFHICCWKKLKAATYSDKNEKDFLKYRCLTPDCKGVISHIVIYDSTGEVKCEFEDKISKKKEPSKPVVKPKPTSTKKPKPKKENRSERKESLEEEHVDQPPGDGIKAPPEKVLSDPVVTTNGFHISQDLLLSQVMKKQKLIMRGCPISFPQFWESVAAWNVIGSHELNEFDKSVSSPSPTNNKLKHLLHHLYNINNRVKTRVLLYLLRVLHEFLSSDLQEWVFIVDEKGLQAAEEFRSHNEEYLKHINPYEVVSLWNESYAKHINYSMSEHSYINLYDDLAYMTGNEFRCFIWFLEENRNIESVASLGKALDIYFQEMDIPSASTPVYSFEDFSNKSIKNKSKHKKKKQNQPKPLYKISGGISTRPQEDDDLLDDNTLSLLDPNEPFVVPDFLQPDIAEFQSLYDLTEAQYEMLVDDSLLPVRETLYQYFYQILEEHGPLKLDDEILIREYRDFPEETHRMVEASGGLKTFLMDSRDFSVVGDTISLSNYDFLYEDYPEERDHLNPSSCEDFSPPTPDNLDLYSAPSESMDSGVTGYEPQPLFQGNCSFNYGNFADICNSLDHLTLTSCTSDLSENSPDDLELDFDDDILDELTSMSDSESPSMFGDKHPQMVLNQEQQPRDQTQTCHKQPPTGQPQPCHEPPLTDQPLPNQEPPLADQAQPCHEQPLADQAQPYHDHPPTDPLQPCSYNKVSNGERRPTAIVSVQVDVDVSHCEINTDAFQPFESRQGDMLRIEKEQKVLADQLQEATEKYESLRSRYLEEIAALETEIKKTVENDQVAKLELNWLKQEYDNEFKKLDQERKERQDKIKKLKRKNKLLAEAIVQLNIVIDKKKKLYDLHIEHFHKLDCTNFENDKKRLEKQRRKSEEQTGEAKQRAIAAEVILLENRKQSEILKLKFQAATMERNINMIRTVASSNPTPHYKQQLQSMEIVVLKHKKDMETLQVQFDEKIKNVKSNLKVTGPLNPAVTSLPASLNVSVPQSQPSPDPPPAPKSPAPTATSASSAKPTNQTPSKSQAKKAAKKAQAKVASKEPLLPTPGTNPKNPPSAPKQGAAARGPALPEATAPSPAKVTLFDKIMEALHDIFPHYNNADLANFIKEFRTRNNGTLSGLSQGEIISRVTEFVLDYQASNPTSGSPSPLAAPRPGIMPYPSSSPQPKQPWRLVTAGAKNKWQKPEDLESCSEDPCIICHDELKQFPVHRLDCGHCFHKECIKTWLHTQSTCPTCREHALLPEDFPALCGRMRTA